MSYSVSIPCFNIKKNAVRDLLKSTHGQISTTFVGDQSNPANSDNSKLNWYVPVTLVWSYHFFKTFSELYVSKCLTTVIVDPLVNKKQTDSIFLKKVILGFFLPSIPC